MQIKNKVKRKLRRRRKEPNKDKKIWLIEFLNQSDIKYTSLGRKDHVYFGKFNGQRKYKQRQYLLWPLGDILSIANNNAGSEQSFGTMFGEESTFSQHFSFQLFFSFIRSIHSTLTYKTPVYLKYVETHLFFWKG